MQVHQQLLAVILSGTLAFTPLDGYTISPPETQSQGTQPATSQDLPSLVAPIALYPDALIAQILAAATYPTQVVEADRWLQQNQGLSGDALAQAAEQQPWDPSVKALTQFPSVLHNMSQNLSWTSALGDAYFHDQEDVMDTIQDLRARAKAAGTLQSNSQQTVSTEGQTIVIQPAQPTVVYVPTYNPTVVYGAPVPVYSGYSAGDLVAASIISFGVGVAVGAAIHGGWGWGWGAWGCNWHGGSVVYNRNVYISRSTTFVNRNNYYRGGNYRPSYNPGNRPPRPTPYNPNRPGGNYNNVNNRPNNPGNRPNYPNNPGNRPGTPNTPGNRPGNPGNPPAGGNNRPGGGGNANKPTTLPARDPNRGYGQPKNNSRQGAFNGYNQGGATRQESQRGQSSLGASKPAARPAQSRPAAAHAAPRRK